MVRLQFIASGEVGENRWGSVVGLGPYGVHPVWVKHHLDTSSSQMSGNHDGLKAFLTPMQLKALLQMQHIQGSRHIRID